MSPAELSGYLRARAGNEVSTAVRQCAVTRRWTLTRKNKLVAAVIERIIYLAIRDRFAPPVVAIPMPHVRRRLAA
jgi:hypothetical protein